MIQLKGNDKRIKLNRLEFETKIKPFESEDGDLNNFLKNDAKNYLKQRLAVTYLIENEAETIAYFCLSNDIVLRLFADKDGWKKIKKTIPNAKLRSTYPAIKIGRLLFQKILQATVSENLFCRLFEKCTLPAHSNRAVDF